MHTTEDLTKIKKLLSNTDVSELSTRNRTNTMWKFNKLTNVRVFAALLKEVPMGCKDTVLPDPLLRNHSVNCLTFEEITRKPHNDYFCLFRALALHFAWKEETREGDFQIIQSIPRKIWWNWSCKLSRCFYGEYCRRGGYLQADIFLYDIDIVDGSNIGELERRSVWKYSNTVQLLRYKNHHCYVSNISALFKAYRCPSCDQFIKKAHDVEKHMTTCAERVKHVSQKKVYQLRETLIDKLDSLYIPYSDD